MIEQNPVLRDILSYNRINFKTAVRIKISRPAAVQLSQKCYAMGVNLVEQHLYTTMH